jgi:CheY-like chemotaxis protein
MDGAAHVLVVDDEFYVCRSVQKILAFESISSEIATSGRDGLMKARGRKYDLILVDVKMPEMDGFEFVRMAKEIQPETPVVVISGYNTPQTRDQAFEHGAAKFIPKPFTPDEVKLVVLQTLAECAMAGAAVPKEGDAARDPRRAVGYACGIDLEHEGIFVPAEKQKDRIRKLASALNLKLSDIYLDENRDVEILERPAMKKLLQEENRAGVIIVDRIWALSRRREKLQPFLRTLGEKNIGLEIATVMMDVASQYVRTWKETGAVVFGEEGRKEEKNEDEKR